MKVYHFLPSQFALEDLRKRRVKISRLNELNDPFELVAADNSGKEQRTIWENWRKAQVQKWGLVCFSKTWRNPLLWSHYADRHRGMCLGFEIPDKHLIQVTYTKKRLNLDILELYEQGKLTREHMSKVFKTKFSDWSYERESRVYAQLESEDPDTGHYFHSFDDQMKLTEVFAGPLCEETESSIRASLQQEDCSANVQKTRLAFKEFQVCLQQRGFL